MLTVSMLTHTHRPLEAGISFDLVSADGTTVHARAKTDAAGVVTFDVDRATLGPVAIRLDSEALRDRQG